MSEKESESSPKKKNLFTAIVIRLAMVFLLILVFPIAAIYIASNEIYFRSKFFKTAVAQKKFIIFVYSESPNWKTYIENNIFPKIQDYAILLNWSDRNQWNNKEWPVRAFHYWGGRRDFCPLAIVFSNFAKIRVIRFHRSFLDQKHGNDVPLQKAQSQLFRLVDLKIQKETRFIAG